MNQYLLILFFFLFPAMAFCQNQTGKLTGKIKDGQGNPISYANAILSNTRYGSATDKDGNFTITAPAGQYELVISALGYVAFRKTVSITAGETNRMEIPSLAEDVALLEQVVVVGKTAIQEVRETPFNVVALDAKSHYNSTLDLAHLLDKASGVKIREAGGVGSDVNISLNGFTGRHVKIFMDGVPLQGQGSAFQLNNIPVSIAERIEIYKGVVPIEFGADAIGGVINIVTNRTTNTFVDASYSYGSFNTHRTNVVVGHTTKKGFSFQVNAYQNFSDNSYKIKARLFDGFSFEKEEKWFKRFHDGYHNEGIVSKIGVVNKSWADRLFFGLTLSQDYNEIQTSPTNIEWVYGERAQKGKTLLPSLEYYKRDLFVKGLTVRLTGNYNFSNRNNIDTASYRYNWLGEATKSPVKGESAGVNTLTDYNNSNYSSTLNINYSINDKHSLALNDVQSGSARKISSNLPPEELSELDKMRRLSMKNVLGFSYRYRHSRSWNANLFVKNYYQKVVGPSNQGENNNFDEAHPNYIEVKASYNTVGYGAATTYFFKDFQFKVSAEKAYRMPSDNELFGDEISESGNGTLRAENSMNYNLGATMNRTFKKENVLYIDVSGFYRNTKDFIRKLDLQRFGGVVNVNHGTVRNVGVDVEARYYYKNKFMIGGNMTYQDLRNKEKLRTAAGTAANRQYNDRMPNIPYFFGNADASYYIHNLVGKGNVLSVSYSLNFVGEFFLKWESLGGEKLTVPKQISHDLNLTFMLKNGRYNFTFEAKNFTNEELYDNFSLMKPGRAFYGKFRYYFLKKNNPNK